MTGPQLLQLLLFMSAAACGVVVALVPQPTATKLTGIALALIAVGLSVPLWQVA